MSKQGAIVVVIRAHQTRRSGRNSRPISAEIALPRLQSKIKDLYSRKDMNLGRFNIALINGGNFHRFNILNHYL